MHSCGSFTLSRLIVEEPGFSALAGETKTFDWATFLPEVLACDVWQSVQPTSLRQCSPRRKLLCSSLPAWQVRHVSEMALGDLFLKEMIFVGSASSMCVLPGPWHDSQPVAFPFQLFMIDSLACEV